MSIKLFEELSDPTLLEYSDKSSYELYKSIVLDPEDNEFKIIEGMFRDKKDAYERLKKQGYVVRKTFEKKVFDWIEDNSKNNIEAYLMFSTAFSKWRGNNILSDYYVQLLNDIPKLNREKVKGNPDTIGKESVIESVLHEYWKPKHLDDLNGAVSHNITVYPTDELGNRIKDVEPVTYRDVALYPTDNIKKKLDNDKFYRDIWEDIHYNGFKYPGYDFVIEGEEDPIHLNYRQITMNYTTKTNNANYTYGKNLSDQGKLAIMKNELEKELQKAKDELIFDIDGTVAARVEALQQEIDDIKARIAKVQKYQPQNFLTAEEKARYKELGVLLYNNNIRANRNDRTDDQVRADAEKIKNERNQILEIGRKKAAQAAALEDEIEDLEGRLAAGPGMASVDKEYEKKQNLQYRLNYAKKILAYKKAQSLKGKKVNLKDTPAVNTQNKNAQQMASDWAFNKASGTKGYRSKFSNGNFKKESAIPQVNAYTPTKYVNADAGSVNSNIPTDGVITNPGAIQTTGTFVEAWLHGKLNQKLFSEDKTLKPEIRDALLKIADVFKKTLDINVQPVDIYFTGSSANYNYNEQSDLDLHLVYDFEQVGVNAEILTDYLIAKKQLFNLNYDIKIKGIPVEVGVENLNKPIISTAIYSLNDNKWIKQPVETEHKTPMPDMKEYYKIVQEIEEAIESKNSQTIGKLWTKLYTIRKEGLAKEGELGESNALFKKLRNLGYLTRLKDAYYDNVSSELSLEALKEI